MKKLWRKCQGSDKEAARKKCLRSVKEVIRKFQKCVNKVLRKGESVKEIKRKCQGSSRKCQGSVKKVLILERLASKKKVITAKFALNISTARCH